MLSPGAHYAPGEEEDGLEYETNTPSGDSYTTPPRTGGRSEPSAFPSHSPTPGGSDPENSVILCTAEIEAHIESFLEEAEEDMELDNLPPLENMTPLLVPVPDSVVSGFVPFTVNTGQCCVPPKNLLKKVYHPYKDPVGQYRCEPGGWCNDLPCSGQIQLVPRKIRGCGLSDGGSRSGRSCCGTSEEPFNQSGSLCSQHTPTHPLCLGSSEL